jgi:phage tail protein X
MLFLCGAMARSVQLTLSTVMVTGGIWMLTAFLGSRGLDDAPVATPKNANRVTFAASRNPRRIPDPLRPSQKPPVESAGDPLSPGEASGHLEPMTDPQGGLDGVQPLPPVPDTIRESAPPLENAYHSTLAAPPPPLLDAHELPPLVGGSTWKHAAVPFPVDPLSPVAAAPDPTMASVSRRKPLQHVGPGASYVVQDGDDLTSIATRVYGHPAAARVVYEANRALLPSEDLLPIGAILALPPFPAADGRATRSGGWIEPGE